MVPELLESCYKSALQQANRRKCSSVAICAIGVARDSNLGHQPMLPPANLCPCPPMIAAWSTQGSGTTGTRWQRRRRWR